ncbi:MAG: hypothetical protein QM754_02750 [Tepidisphaeraceae bacterium]
MPDRRLLTAAVRRRAWGEIGVRPWTFLSIVLAIAAVVLAATRFGDWQRERRVIESGTPIVAEVAYIGMGDLAKQGSRDEPLSVTLRYTPPGASNQIEANNILPRKPGTVVALKDKISVKIDPQQPSFWTERTASPPFGLALITPLLCAAVAVACVAVAFLKRAGVLKAFQNAEPKRAVVRGVRQSPLAPMSKLVSIELEATDPDRRVRDCYWPARLGAIHPKQPIDVLVYKRRAFATAAFGENVERRMSNVE